MPNLPNKLKRIKMGTNLDKTTEQCALVANKKGRSREMRVRRDDEDEKKNYQSDGEGPLLKFEQQFVARRGTVCRKLPKSERRGGDEDIDKGSYTNGSLFSPLLSLSFLIQQTKPDQTRPKPNRGPSHQQLSRIGCEERELRS